MTGGLPSGSSSIPGASRRTGREACLDHSDSIRANAIKDINLLIGLFRSIRLPFNTKSASLRQAVQVPQPRLIESRVNDVLAGFQYGGASRMVGNKLNEVPVYRNPRFRGRLGSIRSLQFCFACNLICFACNLSCFACNLPHNVHRTLQCLGQNQIGRHGCRCIDGHQWCVGLSFAGPAGPENESCEPDCGNHCNSHIAIRRLQKVPQANQATIPNGR